jgi:hypothetical protein
MPQVGFEPTIPVFKRAKTVHDFDRPATVVGRYGHTFPNMWVRKNITPYYSWNEQPYSLSCSSGTVSSDVAIPVYPIW